MKFAIAVHGTRGDVEPCAAVGVELQRRGHDVRMAVPPNLIGFAEQAGLRPAVPYGTDSDKQLEADIFRKWWSVRNPSTVFREARAYITDGWAEMSRTLVDISADAKLILSGTTYQEIAANVADFRGIPLAALHIFPARANNHVLPVRVPMQVVRPVWTVAEWVYWRVLKPAEDEQRRELNLPVAATRAISRIVERGTLEIQAYDQVLFPGLQEQWAGKRPLIGTLTLQMPTDVDTSVMSWIDVGDPPVYFGFGSMPVQDPNRAAMMISEVCSDLGLRALICSAALDQAGRHYGDHVRIVSSVNHTLVFPRCRAIVHHGGAGTTAAGLRAGVPTVVLWVGAEQPVWANQIKRLGVGTSRRFSTITRSSLLEALRMAVAPEYAARAREVAAEMTAPSESVALAADLIEAKARER